MSDRLKALWTVVRAERPTRPSDEVRVERGMRAFDAPSEAAIVEIASWVAARQFGARDAHEVSLAGAGWVMGVIHAAEAFASTDADAPKKFGAMFRSMSEDDA